MAPLDDSSAADAAEVIVNELARFSPSLAERDRWLVLNKCDQILEEEHEARVKEVVDRLQWTGPVYVISAIASEGTERLTRDIMRYLEDRLDRLANDPAYADELRELDQRIEDEARAHVVASRASMTSVTMTGTRKTLMMTMVRKSFTSATDSFGKLERRSLERRFGIRNT